MDKSDVFSCFGSALLRISLKGSSWFLLSMLGVEGSSLNSQKALALLDILFKYSRFKFALRHQTVIGLLFNISYDYLSFFWQLNL